MSRKKRSGSEAEPEILPEAVTDTRTETLAFTARGPSVGEQLRSAREAAGLDIQEVARTLKFSPRQIELLETDNHDALPGNTIVRGFVRSYARFLKLDVDGLLRQLDERIPSVTADVRPPDNMGAAKQPWDGRQVPLVVSLVIAVIVLAVLAFGLWHFYGPALTKAREATLSPAIAPQSPAAVAVPVEPPLPQQQPVQEPPVSPGEGNPPAPPGPSSVVAPAAVTPPRLVLTFTDRSWVEVTDATQRVIHSGENPAGSQLNLDGRPPFELVIGNPTKVKLAYGERSIDLAPHTRADVARLKVE